MDTLLDKVKANLILEHTADDELMGLYITATVSYADCDAYCDRHWAF